MYDHKEESKHAPIKVPDPEIKTLCGEFFKPNPEQKDLKISRTNKKYTSWNEWSNRDRIEHPILSEYIKTRIRTLKEANFSHVATRPNGKKILIQHHTAWDNKLENLDPINPNEAEIQALQYIEGMLLISNNLPGNIDKNKFKNEIDNVVRLFGDSLKQGKITANNTRLLAEDFATIIATHMKVSADKARTQVTMARDIAIMMDDQHPAVCTISENEEKQISAELAEMGQVGSKFYNNHFSEDWRKIINKFAGYEREDTWLNTFFTNPNNMEQLKNCGVPAPPSARWFELPGNYQVMQTYTAKLDEQKSLAEEHTSDFVRLGTPWSFNLRIDKTFAISDEDSRLKKKALELKIQAAEDQLTEIIQRSIEKQMKDYRDSYGNLADNTFFVDYVNILSPLQIPIPWVGEEKLPHADNNTLFVIMAKKAMEKVQKNLKNTYPDIDIICEHTNSAVNHRAGYARQVPGDDEVIQRKFDAISSLVKKVEDETKQNNNELSNILNGKIKDYKPADLKDQVEGLASQIENNELLKDKSFEVRKDIATRMRAACALRMLRDNHPPYNKLKKYQRNIMKSSLELLMQGKQAVKLLGCKSARDRTAILMGSVKTMLENKDAMQNWEILNKGMIKSLKQGHHFRAMIYHVAVVKVKEVHKVFMKALPKTMQKSIKKLLKFSKTLGSATKKILGAATNSILQRLGIKSKKANLKIEAVQEVAPSLPVKDQQKLSLTEFIQEIKRIVLDETFWKEQNKSMPPIVKEIKAYLSNLNTIISFDADDQLFHLAKMAMKHPLSKDNSAANDLSNLLIRSGNKSPEELHMAIDQFQKKYTKIQEEERNEFSGDLSEFKVPGRRV